MHSADVREIAQVLKAMQRRIVSSILGMGPVSYTHLDVYKRQARLRLALQELGPIFVKFGQILSTRRDLVPPDIADELTQLQDRVAPFDGMQARALVEAALGRSISAVSYTHLDVYKRQGLRRQGLLHQ